MNNLHSIAQLLKENVCIQPLTPSIKNAKVNGEFAEITFITQPRNLPFYLGQYNNAGYIIWMKPEILEQLMSFLQSETSESSPNDGNLKHKI